MFNLFSGGSKLTGDQIIREVKRGRISIGGFDISHVNANSYDVTLGSNIMRILDRRLDFGKEYEVEMCEWDGDRMVLRPDELYLGVTQEFTYTPYHVPMYDGRSTTGRYFLSSHVTAGFGDIGFFGNWTLEISVKRETVIYNGMRIGQISFEVPYGKTRIKYPGRYSTQSINHPPMPKKGAPNNYESKTRID